MLRRLRADLHVHTCLSPCGDLQMSPRKIAAQARKQDVAIIAICDHNSAENVPAVIKSAEGVGVAVLPGMEICTCEEIHLLAIFDNMEAVDQMQALVYRHLDGHNDPDVFGLQVIANELDEVMGFEDRLLIGAADLTVDQVVGEIHRLGGVAVASHIDRESYSVISQLGFIPETLRFDALELSRYMRTEDARKRFAGSGRWTFVRNSDAHFLDDIGLNTCEYLVESPTLSEISKALKGENGRMVCET
jgi:predicted metal-dependent phosphoesterase TrpH